MPSRSSSRGWSGVAPSRSPLSSRASFRFKARPWRPSCPAATSTRPCSPRSSRTRAKLPNQSTSEHDAERDGLGLAARVSALFAAFFFVAGLNVAYLPLWLAWTGLGPREIAIVTAAPLFVRVAATPLIAFAADRSGEHRRFLVALSWGVLGALLVLTQARGFWAILACALVFAVAWTTIMPLTETVAVAGVKAAGLDYGRMRLWGSLSFVAASFGGGLLLERLGAGAVVWLIVAGGALMTAAAHAL